MQCSGPDIEKKTTLIENNFDDASYSLEYLLFLTIVPTTVFIVVVVVISFFHLK
jgi:hypothetical protein